VGKAVNFGPLRPHHLMHEGAHVVRARIGPVREEQVRVVLVDSSVAVRGGGA
jgi:hypothetical protein